MVITVEHAGAERGLLVLLRNGMSQIKAEAITSRDKVEVHLRHEPITPFAVPESILNYVIRTGQKVILDDALDPASVFERRLCAAAASQVRSLPPDQKAGRIDGVALPGK